MTCQIGGFVQLDVTVAGKLHRSRKSRRYTAPNAADQHFYREYLVPEEPKNQILGKRMIALEELWKSSRHG
jgi:hypothetical protein